jgi:hypothetical protein
MGTQQSRSGHGRQGSDQASQKTDRRPEQDRDLQRVKQGDRGQHHPSGGAKRQQSQSDASNRQPSQSGASNRQPSQSGASSQQGQPPETQQSQLGGHRDFEHRLENEGREENRMQQAERRQMSQQNAQGREPGQRGPGQMDALRGGGDHGEGSYGGTRQYDDAVKDFAQSGRVEEAARAAAPKSDAEAREMEAAEAEGKRRAKGEDPALTKGSQGPRPGREEN